MREGVINTKEKRKIKSEENKKNILNFLEKETERSSIPLSKNSILFLFFVF
jgi:hypothetical protein